jgi:hypothetical protein
MPNATSTSRRLYRAITVVLLLAAASAWIQVLLRKPDNILGFDDAYMFLRYAHNLRHGLGMSWNLDGQHTYGPTSLLWAFCMFFVSFLPLTLLMKLKVASWACSVAAFFAISWSVARNAESDLFRERLLRVLPWVVLPLAVALGGPSIFAANAVTGMETMLATALCALFGGLALLWRRNAAPSWLLALVGFLLYMARPEAALVVVLLPALIFFLYPGPAQPKSRLALVLGLFLVAMALQLELCKLYFGTPLPLSVYMKGKHAYLGYAGVWHPELLMMEFFTALQVYVGVVVLLARRSDRRLLLCFLTPVALVFAYLGTVTQIMGFSARYYMPYAPLLVLPALLILDRWWASTTSPEFATAPPRFGARAGFVAVLALVAIPLSIPTVANRMKRLEHRHREEYDAAQLTMAAKEPLAFQGWSTGMKQITDLLVAPLPAGTSVAATEVGYIGAAAPQVNIIDLAGLNDTEIALHGFDMKAFMARKADVIWMPNLDYTQQRGVMFSDPAFLQQYDLYADAANYGIALRKDSPYRAQIDAAMRHYWSVAYPGTSMEQYHVTSATWTGLHHTVYGE